MGNMGIKFNVSERNLNESIGKLRNAKNKNFLCPFAFDVFFTTLEMNDKVCNSNDRIELSFASYHKPSELQSKDFVFYKAHPHARFWTKSNAVGSR